MNVPCPAGGRMYHSIGSGSVESSGVARTHGEIASSSSVAVASRTARARRVEPLPQSAAVHAMDGPMMFRMSTFKQRRRPGEPAEHERLQPEEKGEQEDLPAAAFDAAGGLAGRRPRSICAEAASADRHTREEEKQRRAHAAEHHGRPYIGRARSPASVQASKVCASIMTSTATPRSQSR